MTTNPDPTPPPFALPLHRDGRRIEDSAHNPRLIAVAETETGATHLVRCANALPGLVAALEGYRKAFIETVGDPSVTPEMDEADEAARAALKLAEAQP